MSQGQLAKKLGVTRQAINLWENRRELEEMLDILRQAVFPKDRSRWTAWYSNVAMNRMRCILGGMTDALEAIHKQSGKRKMDCYYLMMQVELALALALGGIEEADLPHQKLDNMPGLDTDHITSLAMEFQNWSSKHAEMSDALFTK